MHTQPTHLKPTNTVYWCQLFLSGLPDLPVKVASRGTSGVAVHTRNRTPRNQKEQRGRIDIEPDSKHSKFLEDERAAVDDGKVQPVLGENAVRLQNEKGQNSGDVRN